jgi:hypothetical protein
MSNAGITIATIAANGSSQSHPPTPDPLNDRLMIKAEIVTYGRKNANSPIIPPMPAIR